MKLYLVPGSEAIAMPKPPATSRRLMLAIVLGLVAWGLYHTIGAYESARSDESVRYDFRRSLVVAGFFVAFLAFWGLALVARRARLRREAERDVTKD
jgi:hypothetical protein